MKYFVLLAVITSSYNSAMELRHLRYFDALATTLNFTRAAERQLVAQPALSKQIADLEAEVGVPLVYRTKRVVQLTAAGHAFWAATKEILARADAAPELARRAARGEVGTLSIGFFGAPTMAFLPALVRDYRARYPGIRIDMQELNPVRQLAAFEDGTLDVAFTRPVPAGHAGVVESLMFRERLFAVVSTSHPLAGRGVVSLAELAQEPFVLLEREEAAGLFDQVVAACAAAGFPPTLVNAPRLMSTVLTLVAAEQGVAIVPESVQNLRGPGVSFLALTPAPPPIDLVLAWRQDADSPPAEAFRALALERRGAIARSFVLEQRP